MVGKQPIIFRFVRQSEPTPMFNHEFKRK